MLIAGPGRLLQGRPAVALGAPLTFWGSGAGGCGPDWRLVDGRPRPQTEPPEAPGRASVRTETVPGALFSCLLPSGAGMPAPLPGPANLRNVCVHTHTHTGAHTCLQTHAHTCRYTCAHVHAPVHTCLQTRTHMSIHMCAHTRIFPLESIFVLRTASSFTFPALTRRHPTSPAPSGAVSSSIFNRCGGGDGVCSELGSPRAL